MKKLTPSERDFFALVHEAVYANPFSDRRSRVDLEIAGLFPGRTDRRGFGETLARVRRHIQRLEETGRATLTAYGHRDRQLLTSSFLFDLFHRFTDQFDRLIIDQLNAGDRSLPVPFAGAVIDLLIGWGFDGEMARRYLAMCYQLRRAFFFIDKHLKGRSESMRRLRESLWNNVFTHDMDLYHRYLWNRMEDFSTMLLGETGSGKGTAAMAIGRSGFIPFDEKKGCFDQSFTRSFIALNLSQYPETLIESELFGHRKGAFTGAVEDYEGVFDRCSPFGAILLDEIGEVGEPIQIKLLQVIQERIFRRVGDHRARPFRGRVIAATNLPAEQLLGGQAMRKDFFYRLCSDLIVVPSLARRIHEDPNELQDLLQIVIERIVGVPSKELTSMVKAQIHHTPGLAYPWPGNVRELEQAARRILMKQDYTPMPPESPSSPAAWLQTGFQRQDMTARALVAGYCLMLHQQHQTIEAVARITGLDRRTAKKHIEEGKHLFVPGRR
ncbi:Fis family transcriptional regulator [Desulfosarcina alkanivorans]|uniref:Fis family transcriptional regulator n=1 Tax=Desulfosarcina alkanivorans TaxID=571177 RepID=A0A5K7YJ76_9BACT|nr:sigma 54-interacting transcriptional regulator [Desulfosarcina alkanivorans]BBO68180.1 Fis family transcriptional regulator [Desulfosarcina alkanivorans]